MVTIYKVLKSDIDGAGKFLVELRGLSTDEKPTTLDGGAIINGSEFLEIDTQTLYLFDQENGEWLTPTTPDDNENEPAEPGEE